MIFLRNLEYFLRNLDQIQKKFRNFLRISRKKFRTFFEIFVSRPMTESLQVVGVFVGCMSCIKSY